MNPLHPNTGLLPPALRALALGLLVETVVPLLGNAPEEGPGPSGPGDGNGNGGAELWQDLRGKCGELSAIVLRAHDPGEAAAYVLDYLPKHFDYIFELLCSQKRRPSLDGLGTAWQVALQHGGRDAELA
jgi:hypothetical protein